MSDVFYYFTHTLSSLVKNFNIRLDIEPCPWSRNGLIGP